MKAEIEVKDRKEADLIRRGLEDEQTRALVKVLGVLQPMTGYQQRRILNYVNDRLSNRAEIIYS